MTLKLACAQCWRDGQITEADKALKYCNAKARHVWVEEGVDNTTIWFPECICIQIILSKSWVIFLSSCDVATRWSKDRRILLVRSLERSKWVHVRPVPHSKNFPLQYEVGSRHLLLLLCCAARIFLLTMAWNVQSLTSHGLCPQMCAQILKKNKCNYTGLCTFAHSQEERELWMYMKKHHCES